MRLVGVFAAAILLFSAIGSAEAARGDRTLKLYFGHTGERGEFTFKRNGRYDKGELKRLNYFLRDWRKKEPTDMDPRLFDLVWAIYQDTGSRDYIHVVSAYRSPETNAKLRSRSSGVAKKSQHMLGKAMDFYIPDVPVDRLRATAMKFQVGGVGYYPSSGSPFIHADVGSVRAWPRMTRQQLVKLFPDGETLHLPADGKPLPGYQSALSKYGSASKDYQLASIDRKLGGGSSRGSGRIQVAQGDKPTVASWLKKVFTDGEDEGDEEAGAMPTAPARSAPVMVAAAEIAPPPLPRTRPGEAPAATNAGSAIELLAGETASPSTQLAYAPLPRLRPAEVENASAVVASVPAPETRPTVQTAALAPRQDDTLAELAARMAVDEPTSERSLSPEDIAKLTRLAAAKPAPAEQMPESPRPTELAYAAVANAPDSAVAALVTAAYEKDDTDILTRIASAHSVSDTQFAAFAQPEPNKVPELFTIPENADAVEQSHGKKILTAEAVAAQPQARAGFFGRLVSNLF